MGLHRPLFVDFRPFHNANANIVQILLYMKKAYMVCLGLEHGTAGR